ncbi:MULTISPECIES: hypothetical protein [unclassified Methanoregula]|uniref:hypothetical protein n=1 Tax=unclassified Methanoregula TaxID=2649730 RepID=UPI0025F03C93|nr:MULTISPECIES: hypothetical protein [unclassified Methanoregula]
MSGHCRWISLAALSMIIFCCAAASAATASAATTADCPSGCSCLQPSAAQEKGYAACGGQLSACGYDIFQKTMYCYKTPQLVLVPRTLQTLVVATTTPPGTCPAGCSCMMEAEAKEKFGTYSRCSETPCYTVNTGSTSLKAYCFRQGTPPTTTTPAPACPAGCTCLSDTQAKERYGTYTRCTENVCGYDSPANMVAAYQIPRYCVKQGSTTPVCPDGCYCVSEAVAKDRYGTYTRCSNDVCGYEQNQAPKYCIKPGGTTPVCPEGCYCVSEAVAKDRYGTYTRCSDTVCGYEQDQTRKFCIKPGGTTPVCPEGCSCISEATAKAKGGSWTRCTSDVCGYEQSTATLAAVVQVPKYCMKQQETAPVCPEGCACLTDGQAKERYGTFTRCSADVCGYEMSAPTNALASGQIPKYCVKQGTTPACPDGCACISDEDAKLKGLTERCDTGQNPCGYTLDSSSATTAARRIPLYCYKIPTTTTPSCPEGCTCLSEAKAKERYGTFTRCSEEVCGKEVVPAANGIAAYSVPQYCVKQGTTPVCPEGCACISDEDAKLKGLTDRCDTGQSPCGYRTSATTANQRIPLYCYKIPTTTPVCPQGCGCMTNATGAEKGLSYCGGKLISCGYDQNKQPQYCFGEVTTPSCTYDYQKNACTGTCSQGYTCSLAASRKDETGKVVYAACRCTGQQATPCGYDSQKGECTGVCQIGKTCVITGKETDKQTGKETPVCGCPWNTCTYDFDKNVCTGSCPVSGENCQLNTIYRDPASGKVTFADCTCKGGAITETCACDATSGSCTGNCADGRACTMVERTTDNAGKIVCSKCECRDSCVLTSNNECAGTCATGEPCTRIVYRDDSGNEKVGCGCGGISQAGGTPAGTVVRQQGFFEGIGEFFRRLFGGK